MSKEIGIGVIGTGFARRTQIPGFGAVDGARVVSVASGSIENARSTARQFGIEHFTNNWHETIEHGDVDVVCVTTPPNMHLQMTAEALRNGKHVLCEKPMAMNIEEAVEMNRLAEESGLMAIIDHELRFTNGRQKAFEILRNGEIGKIRHAKYLFRNASRGNADLPWTWWSDVSQGGGALGAIGSHVIDTFRWFLDADFSEVYCRLHTHIKERPTPDGRVPVTSDDESLMIFKFADSPFVDDATAIATNSMVEAGPYRNRVEFFGTKGAIRIEDGGELYISDIQEGVWNQIELDLGNVAPGMDVGGWSRGFTVLSRRIVEALRRKETAVEHAATFSDGVAIQRVIDAARESNKTSKAVRIF